MEGGGGINYFPFNERLGEGSSSCKNDERSGNERTKEGVNVNERAALLITSNMKTLATARRALSPSLPLSPSRPPPWPPPFPLPASP